MGATSATRRILHIITDNLTDLNEAQFGNSLNDNAYFKNSTRQTDWGGKDSLGLVQSFVAWDQTVEFEKLYLGTANVKNAIIIATQATDDESATSTTRASRSINIGRGAGCLLIKKEVFENLPFPWFRYPIIHKYYKGKKHTQMVMEDVGFSMLVKEHGYKIFMDCDVKADHLARDYQRDHTINFDLLFKNVNDDVNKLCQLTRMMGYRIADLEKRLHNKEEN